MSGFPAAECTQSLIYFKIATITAAFFTTLWLCGFCLSFFVTPRDLIIEWT